MIKLRFVRSFVLISGLALCAVSLAQTPLAELAPPDTAVAITFSSSGSPFADLRQDLSELDWQGAGETLRAILASTEEELGGLADLFGGAGGEDLFEAAFEDSCPELQEPLLQLANGRWLPPMQGVVALEISGILPAVTAVVRLKSASPTILEGIRSALAECATPVPTETISGTIDLYYLANGSAPVATVTDDGLLVVASAPHLVLDLLSRRDQPSEMGELLATLDRFEQRDSYIGIAIRPAAFANAAGALVGTSASDQALLTKITAALETVESVAAQWSASDSGTVSEWAVEVDPNGPDRALTRLLLCDSCRASTPFLVPDGAIAVSSSRLPLEALVDYLQGWLEAAGESQDLRALLQSELGIDIDADLFDWLGQELHMAVLGPVGTDLTTLVYGPGQVFMVPVTSEADAAAGIGRIQRAIEERLAEEFTRPEFPVAVRQVEYRGFEYDRVQASFNLDLGLGLVGNHLVLASPSGAIEPVIDTFLGEPGIVSRASYRDAVASTPREAQAVAVQDQSVQLREFGQLLRLAAQPAAFGLQLATANASAAVDEGLVALWPVSTGDALPQVLPVSAPEVTVEGELNESAGDPYIEFELSDLYSLEGLEAGDQVTVVLESDEFDTAVSLIDLQQQVVFEYNDDAPDTSRSEIAFTYEEGLELAVQVTSFSGSDIGGYRLTVAVEESAARVEIEATAPTFADILTVTELPSKVLEILADHVGSTVGYTVTEGNVIYTRSETGIR